MLTWTVRREDELAPGDHGELAAMLRQAFPGYRHAFTGRRSWAGARPELRVLGHDEDGVAAHAGVLRRFLQVGDAHGGRGEQLVAVVGVVAVRPDLQGRGVGRELGAHLAAALHALAVPFGLLGCGPDRTGFYQAVGWHGLPPTPMTYAPLDVDDPARAVTDRDGWMVLPVTAPLERWPAGELHWNGPMI